MNSVRQQCPMIKAFKVRRKKQELPILKLIRREKREDGIQGRIGTLKWVDAWVRSGFFCLKCSSSGELLVYGFLVN